MKKFALIGETLKHSFSPLIHKELFVRKNIEATYDLLPTSIENLKDRIDDLKCGKYSGYNVTIPYKVEIMKYLDEISLEAKEIGSVNTICIKNGKVIGYNTDYYGFKGELEYYNLDASNKECYILGTGGASLAVKKVLKDLNANINLVSRKKTDLTLAYDELENKKIDLLINTTPVGMYPDINESPIDEIIARNCTNIVDIIFNPLKTKLMSYNCNSYNGLVMLILQAAYAQDIWFDKKKDINYQELIDYIGGVLNEQHR